MSRNTLMGGSWWRSLWCALFGHRWPLLMLRDDREACSRCWRVWP